MRSHRRRSPRPSSKSALRIGFDLVGVAPPVAPATLTGFHDWLDKGFAGEMGYLARREEAYAHPKHVFPGVRSVVMLAANYRTAEPAPPAPLNGPCLTIRLERRRLSRTPPRAFGETGRLPPRTATRLPDAKRRRHGPPAGTRFCPRRGPRLVRQEHDADQQASRKLAVSGRSIDRRGAGA